MRVEGLGSRVQGAGVQGSGFRVQGSEFRVWGSGFRVQGLGFRVQGSGFRVHAWASSMSRSSCVAELEKKEGVAPSFLLTRKRTPLGPYRRLMPRALWWS